MSTKPDDVIYGCLFAILWVLEPTVLTMSWGFFLSGTGHLYFLLYKTYPLSQTTMPCQLKHFRLSSSKSIDLKDPLKNFTFFQWLKYRLQIIVWPLNNKYQTVYFHDMINIAQFDLH